MAHLFINGGGPIAGALAARFAAHAAPVHSLALPADGDDADRLKAHFAAFAAAGGHYANIYIDLTEGCDEAAEFEADAALAARGLARRLKELLKALKYGAQHMARGDGGCLWVLCYDHSVSISVSAPSNPVTNLAAQAAVQCVAKEVAHFGVRVNLMMIHPPAERIDALQWRQAKDDLNVYRLRYKPQSADQVAELLQMYAGLSNFSTTGGVIPVGSGIAVCNI